MRPAFLRSARQYLPGVYPGKLIILRATEVDAELLDAGSELGWTGHAAGGIQAFDVPGNHYSLLEEPNVHVLGATLKSCLEAAEISGAV